MAIGECGLDSSKNNKNAIDTQLKAFQDQLDLAKRLEMPIVIHCRDLEAEVFTLLKKNLDTFHRIHLHCFTGGKHFLFVNFKLNILFTLKIIQILKGLELANKYLERFPNLCVGVTPKCSRDETNEMKEMIKKIDVTRLLLETDSPYFLPTSQEPDQVILMGFLPDLNKVLKGNDFYL